MFTKRTIVLGSTSSKEADEAFGRMSEAFSHMGDAFGKMNWDNLGSGSGIECTEADGTVTLKGEVKNVIVNGKVVWSAQ
jgi:hypothetical protein